MPRAVAKSSGPRPILLVDDDPQVRLFLSRTLRLHGLTVYEAAHGADALELLQSHAATIGLVITDVRMPIVDGIQLARAVMTQWPAMPIVFISGHTDPRVGGGPELASAAFLPKPFDDEQLLAVVRQFLGDWRQSTVA
ncbi:MAG TPA: response regulator [Gemmatimonadales bacterium]|nr:response regulator [Gemmatimonadales bacterium]